MSTSGNWIDCCVAAADPSSTSAAAAASRGRARSRNRSRGRKAANGGNDSDSEEGVAARDDNGSKKGFSGGGNETLTF